MNKIIIIGNATKDPEAGGTKDGTTWARVGVAVNGYTNKETGETHCDFFDVFASGTLAGAVQKYVKKGKKIAVIGRMNQKTYTDKDGVRRVSWSLIADSVEFLSPREEEEPKAEAGTPKGAKKIDDYDDIPF